MSENYLFRRCELSPRSPNYSLCICKSSFTAYSMRKRIQMQSICDVNSEGLMDNASVFEILMKIDTDYLLSFILYVTDYLVLFCHC